MSDCRKLKGKSLLLGAQQDATEEFDGLGREPWDNKTIYVGENKKALEMSAS